jgi:hypothetical protein
MRIPAANLSGKNVIGSNSVVVVSGIRQATSADFSQVTARVQFDAIYESGGPTTFTGNLGSQRSLGHYTRFQGAMSGDKLAFVSSSGPQPDNLSVTENGHWHWDSINDILTYGADGVIYRLEIFGAVSVTHSNNVFTFTM